MSKLKACLEELDQLYKQYLANLVQDKSGNASGTWNTINFVTLALEDLQVNVQRKKQIAQFSIAVSECSKFKSKEQIESSLGGLKLLESKGVRSPFIQSLLYYDKEGGKITERAAMDLFVYEEKHKKTFTLDALKKWMGQLVLSVEALHRHHLVHRDIKPENILVMRNGKIYYLQLADLDEVIEVNSQKQNRLINPGVVTGTPVFFSPELSRDLSDEAYNKQDLKAADCYALGMTFFEIAFYLLPNNLLFSLLHSYPLFKIAKWREFLKSFSDAETVQFMKSLCEKKSQEMQPLVKLMKSLLHENPAERATIGEVKQHEFFGKTSKEREQFFAEIHEESNQDLYVDHFYWCARKEEDLFYFFSSDIKLIYDALEKLDNELDCLDKFKMPFERLRMLRSIERLAVDLSQMLDEVLKQRVSNSWLMSVQAAVNEEMKEIKQFLSQANHDVLKESSQRLLKSLRQAGPNLLTCLGNLAHIALEHKIEVSRRHDEKTYLHLARSFFDNKKQQENKTEVKSVGVVRNKM